MVRVGVERRYQVREVVVPVVGRRQGKTGGVRPSCGNRDVVVTRLWVVYDAREL